MNTNTFDLIIKGATLVTPAEVQADVGIQNGKITAIGNLEGPREFKAAGLHCLPGVIDTQVHFRDPGAPEKEDLISGSRAAVFGGVTAFFDMPNTQPPTLSALDVADKMSRADGKLWTNYAFYLGASAVNAERLHELEKLPGVCGIKMFMGSSTGNLVVGSDDVMAEVLKHGHRPVAVHAEDNPRLSERKKIVTDKPGDVRLHPVWRDEETALIATKKILKMAEKLKRHVHILHVTTAEEALLLKDHKATASFEITPQHLTLYAPDCYEKLGTLAQMNPPIRDKRHYDGLWTAVQKGWVDVLGSDHAPHTLTEKRKTYPDTPSGMTGVQTLVPIMLNHVNAGRLSLSRLVELTSQNPARIFGIQNKGAIKVGYDADFTLVDLKKQKTITNSWIQSKCGWTPFDGEKVTGWVAATIIGGEVVMRDDQLVGKPRGKPLTFQQL